MKIKNIIAMSVMIGLLGSNMSMAVGNNDASFLSWQWFANKKAVRIASNLAKLAIGCVGLAVGIPFLYLIRASKNNFIQRSDLIDAKKKEVLSKAKDEIDKDGICWNHFYAISVITGGSICIIDGLKGLYLELKNTSSDKKLDLKIHEQPQKVG